MDNPKTEAEKNMVIAQHSRRLYVRHMDARVLRRTLSPDDEKRRLGVRAERNALDDLIGVIEKVDKSGSAPT